MCLTNHIGTSFCLDDFLVPVDIVPGAHCSIGLFHTYIAVQCCILELFDALLFTCMPASDLLHLSSCELQLAWVARWVAPTRGHQDGIGVAVCLRFLHLRLLGVAGFVAQYRIMCGSVPSVALSYLGPSVRVVENFSGLQR